eukprot:CAMPEP_0180787994 /NCGR_PEP_ID=MMETSP1038_2-20121128/51707_1 /TAXON_ID=632150 /ORGANISM="Azadinium spinosum, Strain 3D9" /LENGTH=60 /DNA_ID=CAMNT_0022825373 /DNA_START=210 /DNA_END=392 /DNA_ORIENTATION=-
MRCALATANNAATSIFRSLWILKSFLARSPKRTACAPAFKPFDRHSISARQSNIFASPVW